MRSPFSYFKSIGSLLVLLTFYFFSAAQQPVAAIRINQLGYYPRGPKIAIVTGAEINSPFYIVSIDSKDTVFRGELGKQMKSGNSSLKTRVADFSALDKRGSFQLVIPSLGSSYPFSIAPNVMHAVAVGSLKGYYYMRVSMPLEEKYAGKWARPAGHPDTKVVVHPSAASITRPAGTIISCPGGWYDAGDYNKYIVNSGITMGTLLSAYEDFGPYFDSLKTNIPESRGVVPDLLNEIIYNLRWMLTMQDPEDGGVYNKCTNAAFDGMVMPGVTQLPRYVVQKGVAATLDFAAVTAQAARILMTFKKQIPKLGDSCLRASKKAWAWAMDHPAMEYNQDSMNKIFQPVISTGGYGDKQFDDEWFWAATELMITTGNAQYAKALLGSWKAQLYTPSWNRVGIMGICSLIRFQKRLPALPVRIDSIKVSLLNFVDQWVLRQKTNAFQTIMGQTPRDFVWGSNGLAANQGMLLVRAFLITQNKMYLAAALSNLDYLLGRNATGYCFVTGFGSKSPMHPHHRPSVADGIKEPVPGLLAGGPNPGRQDGCKYEFTEPETCYSDTECSYASNEIAINWNAPLVYLANAIEALQYSAGLSSNNP